MYGIEAAGKLLGELFGEKGGGRSLKKCETSPPNSQRIRRRKGVKQ